MDDATILASSGKAQVGVCNTRRRRTTDAQQNRYPEVHESEGNRQSLGWKLALLEPALEISSNDA